MGRSLPFALSLVCLTLLLSHGSLVLASANSNDSVKLSRPLVSRWFGQPRYRNPWSTWHDFWTKIKALLRWKLSHPSPEVPSKEVADETLPVLESDDILRRITPRPEADQVRVTWLGHASVLLQFQTANVLCDPVFTDRVGLPWPLPGEDRYRRPPLKVEDLPDIDAVVISHNHHDHLDLTSVKELRDRFADKIHWFVPMGLKEWMSDNGGVEKEHVTELTWWDSGELKGKNLTFTLTPSQHWSFRSISEMFSWSYGFNVLWGSWAICSQTVKTWFGGDTGYCEAFKEIGMEFGGFDLAVIPIGAYLPRDVMRDQHVDPGESVKIHQDLKSKKSVGMHWGTFAMGSLEPYMAPMRDLARERELAAVAEEDFFVLDHGGSAVVTAERRHLPPAHAPPRDAPPRRSLSHSLLFCCVMKAGFLKTLGLKLVKYLIADD